MGASSGETGRVNSRRRLRPARLALAILLLGVFSVAARAVPSYAVPARPPYASSIYVTSTSTSTAYNEGCGRGTADANHGDIDSSAFLDFGGQNSDASGTKLINGISVSAATIRSIAEQYADGYWVCTGTDHVSTLFLAVGTNNSYDSPGTAGGSAWATMVSNIQSWVNSNIGQVVIRGGNDLEPSWNLQSHAENWAQAFDAGFSGNYLDYGSADGCSETSSTDSACNNGWTTYGEWYLTWGESAALGAPEIYYSAQAKQWTMISLYGADHQSGAALYQAPLDEHDIDSSTLTPDEAWADLWNDLNAHSATKQTPPFSMEVRDE